MHGILQERLLRFLKINRFSKPFSEPVVTSFSSLDALVLTEDYIKLSFRVLRNPSREYLKLNSHNVKVAKKPFQTLGHIFAKPKDPVAKEKRTIAIYSILCNDCDDEYIKQTKCQFVIRLKEYQKAVFFCKKENSASSEHTYLTNHTIGWDKSKIVTTNRRYHQRLCLEAWHVIQGCLSVKWTAIEAMLYGKCSTKSCVWVQVWHEHCNLILIILTLQRWFASLQSINTNKAWHPA